MARGPYLGWPAYLFISHRTHMPRRRCCLVSVDMAFAEHGDRLVESVVRVRDRQAK